jgi:hypothetical protein
MESYRGGHPAFNWLVKQDKHLAAMVLAELRDARLQTHSETSNNLQLTGGDDMETHAVPDEPITSETMAEPLQDGPDEVWPDMLHEIRPSERDICRALGWIEWPNSRPRRSEPIGWCMRCSCGKLAPTEGGSLRPTFSDTRANLAGMLFATGKNARRQRDGLMVRYVDARGNEQRPGYRAVKPRGGKRPHRTKAGIEAYLALPAAIPSPLRVHGYTRPLSGEIALLPMLTPLLRKEPGKALDINGQVDRIGRLGVAEARAELVAFCVDGSVPFADLPFHATRGPTVIARSARFMAGISGVKQTASVPAPNWQMPDTKTLSPAIEALAARGTLGDIGEAVRDKTKPAPTRPDRLGARALLAEARALVAANDNSLKKVAA